MNSHLSKTEYRIMEYFWSTGGKYTFGELMKYFNEEEDKNWKKQTLNTFLSRLIDKGLLERKKEETKAYYGAALTKAEFKQRKAKAILEECYEGKISHFIAALTGNNRQLGKEAMKKDGTTTCDGYGGDISYLRVSSY